MSRFAAICLPLLLAAACAGTEPAEPGGQEDQPARTAARTADTAAGPEVERNPLRNAYFGDFHVHSSWSLDAYSLGANRNDPAMAYRFGHGEEVNTADGRVLRLRAPLNIMAVTDHDIWLGTVNLCLDESDAVPERGGSSVAMENRPERLREWLKTACSGDCRVLAISAQLKSERRLGVRRIRLDTVYAGNAAAARLGRAARRDPPDQGQLRVLPGPGHHGRDLDALGRPLHGAQRSTSSCFRFNQSSSTFRRPISSSSPA